MKKSDEEKLLTTIGERIKILRTEKNLSQFQLATDAGIPTNQIGRIERAEINTTILTLAKIAEVLGVPTQELFKF